MRIASYICDEGEAVDKLRQTFGKRHPGEVTEWDLASAARSLSHGSGDPHLTPEAIYLLLPE